MAPKNRPNKRNRRQRQSLSPAAWFVCVALVLGSLAFALYAVLAPTGETTSTQVTVKRMAPPPPPKGPPAVKLSAAVAIPQSLPTGTAMGFSIDYRFTNGRPDKEAEYLWIIAPTKGDPVALPVQLKRRGNLQTFVTQFRPRNGPFTFELIGRAEGKVQKLCERMLVKTMGL